MPSGLCDTCVQEGRPAEFYGRTEEEVIGMFERHYMESVDPQSSGISKHECLSYTYLSGDHLNGRSKMIVFGMGKRDQEYEREISAYGLTGQTTLELYRLRKQREGD